MRKRKSGFTIVELVVVIAVIAILAAALIPTFSGMISSAQQSMAMQYANAAYHLTAMEVGKTGHENMTDSDYLIVSGRFVFRVDRGVGFVSQEVYALTADKKASFAKALEAFDATPSVHFFAGGGDLKALGFTDTVYTADDVTVNSDIFDDVVVLKGKLS